MTETVLRYRFRAYPGAEENRALSRTFGCCRRVANDAIVLRQAAWKAGLPYMKLSELSRICITEAKKRPERAWLSEVSAVALQQSLADVDRAYRNFFSGLRGSRKGRRPGPPRFRSRRDWRQTARFTANARFTVAVTGERAAVLMLPKVGDIPFVCSRELPSEPTSVTVIREPDGRIYVSFVVRVTDEPAATSERACGIDVGLSSFATIHAQESTTGETSTLRIETPAYLRRRARALARSQRSLSRKKKGSKNREKARVRIAVHHRKVREARLDHAHQLAAKVVDEHDVVCVEDLSVRSMARTRLAKSAHDQSIGQFLQLIEEKALRQGRRLVKVGRFYPSTQLCSGCGDQSGPKGLEELKVRHWTCPTCGVSHDRDENAARNILAEGLRLLSAESTEQPNPVAVGRTETRNACGDPVSRRDGAALVGETGRAGEVVRCSAA